MDVATAPLAINSVLTAEDAYAITLREVLEKGIELAADKSSSIGSERSSKELLNYSVTIEKPIQRLVSNPVHKLVLPLAVARFVWLMSGSDRLADIAFYDDRVTYFSDDGISIPGSSFGQRILKPRPGLNQLDAVINRLKLDHSTRRAAISIFQAEDSFRESKDIPCAFGLFYHLRQGSLLATTIMRSNNAFSLLPYNMFEFSMLAEIVAIELGVQIGAMTHFAASMHIYESDYDGARSVWTSHTGALGLDRPTVPPMPTDISPLQQVKELIMLESRLRHGSVGINSENIGYWISEGEQTLSEYWRQLYLILLWFAVRKHKRELHLTLIERSITEPWIRFLRV